MFSIGTDGKYRFLIKGQLHIEPPFKDNKLLLKAQQCFQLEGLFDLESL